MPTIEIVNSDHTPPWLNPMLTIEIINANHTPPWPFMIVTAAGKARGMHVDLSKVQGELWDAPTVAKIEWGHTDVRSGREFGIVILKNGDKRPFWDKNLMRPYLAAYAVRKAEEDATHAANVKANAALSRRLAAQKPQPATLEAQPGDGT